MPQFTKLNAGQIERIAGFRKILAEVEQGRPLEEDIALFNADIYPETEIRVWEAIAWTYQEMIDNQEIKNLPEKNLFIVFFCSHRWEKILKT